MPNIHNSRIKSSQLLISPETLCQELPITPTIVNHIDEARQQVQAIIQGQDRRLLVIVGPCSIHDPTAALEYATHLQRLRDRYLNKLFIVMRVYFEKPRTQMGWKGLINDPDLDNSFKVNKGLRIARSLLLAINEMNIPTASEFLDTTIPQYLADLTTWAAIGARTTESQIHRELASGLSMPVGFKNGTTGNLQIAIDAVFTAQKAHHFLGISPQGHATVLSTTGNPDCHVILRGSTHETNYDAESIAAVILQLKKQSLPLRLMVDCSHGNCQKDYLQQIAVVHSLCQQIAAGSNHILGIMLESHLKAGKQSLISGQPLTYGQSITDGCISWEDTVKILDQLAFTVSQLTHK